MSDGSLTGLYPIAYHALDQVQRENTGLTRAVYIDGKAEQVGADQTIRSFVTRSSTAQTITPGNIAPDDDVQSVDFLDYTISNQRYVAIPWTGELAASVGTQYQAIVQDQIAQAFRTLANEMEATIANTALTVASRATGNSGQTPFAIKDDMTDFSRLNQILDDNGVPMAGRKLILNSAAKQSLYGTQAALFKANEAGTDQLLRQGILNNAYGFDIGYSPAIGTHVKGLTGSFLTVGANVVGDVALTANQAVTTATAGDVVTFAGDTNKYVVNNGTGSVLTINKPGMRTAISNVAVTALASYTPSFAFNAQAIVLGARLPLLPPGGDMAVDSFVVVDPVSGIPYRLALYKGYHKNYIQIQIAYGVSPNKNAFAAVLLG